MEYIPIFKDTLYSYCDAERNDIGEYRYFINHLRCVETRLEFLKSLNHTFNISMYGVLLGSIALRMENNIIFYGSTVKEYQESIPLADY